MELKAQEFFEDLRQKVRMMKHMKLHPDLAKLKAGHDPDIESRARAEDKGVDHEDKLKSPEAQFGVYYMKHGGTSIGLAPKARQPRIDFFCVSRSFADLFKSKDINVETVLMTMGLGLLEDVLGVVESIDTGVLGSLSDLPVELVDGINKPISIPVLSRLYKNLTGNCLTILDAVALVIAIPTTIVYKTVTGKSPMEIPGIQPLAETKAITAIKSELDERMGRLKSENTMQESVPILSHSFQFSAMKQTHVPRLQPTVVTQEGGGVTRSVAVESATTIDIEPRYVPEFTPTKVEEGAQLPDSIVYDDIASERMAKREQAPAASANSVQLDSLAPSASPSIQKTQPKR